MSRAKTAIYLRLSREDDGERESQSIGNQRLLLERYAREHGWPEVIAYIDDGYTGTSFQRPGFQRMLMDIQAGRINTVITKDLSRLGRNYARVGELLDEYFPSHGVRYIAVNEGLDSGDNGRAGTGDLAPFLSVFNDMYAKDISKKVRSALDARRREGRFIGSTPPFGYNKSPQVKGLLEIDPEAAQYVREIFAHYLASGSVSGTARLMTQRGVPTPSQYRGLKHTQKNFHGVWSTQMVRRILSNPTYAGNLTQNRAQTLSYKVRKRLTLPAEEWVVVPDTHEAIIAQEDFERVQTLLRIRSYHGGKVNRHILTGLAYCADCGSPMVYTRGAGRTYMVCKGYRQGGALGLCTPHRVREDDVLHQIAAELRQLSRPYASQVIECCMKQQKQAFSARRPGVQTQLETCRQALHNLYKDWTAGRLTEEEYFVLLTSLRGERDQLETQMAASESESPHEDLQTALAKALEFEPLNRAAATTLIRRIEIRANQQVCIFFTFRSTDA